MKLDEAERLAKEQIRVFAEPRKDLIAANRERFVTHSWKEGKIWCVAAAVFPIGAMDDSLVDDRQETRAVNWVVAKVTNNGEVTLEEINDLDILLST